MTDQPAPDPIPDHMRPLTELERNFVMAMVTGATDGTKAARIAGYGRDSETKEQGDAAARKASYRLKHNEDVQRAIKKEGDAVLRGGGLLGWQVVLEIAADPLHKDRLKAAEKLIGHNGWVIVNEHKHTHEVGLRKTDTEKIERITALAVGMGLDPRALLGNLALPAPDVVDAEYEEIPAEPGDPWTAL